VNEATQLLADGLGGLEKHVRAVDVAAEMRRKQSAERKGEIEQIDTNSKKVRGVGGREGENIARERARHGEKPMCFSVCRHAEITQPCERYTHSHSPTMHTQHTRTSS
jgi:hypothetical protein